MNLVFGSPYSSYMDCEVHCVSSVTIGLIRLRSNSAPSCRLRRWPLHLRGVPVVAEEFLFNCARRHVNFTTFLSLLLIILLPPPP